MKSFFVLLIAGFCTSSFAANLRPTSPITKGDVCGTITKVGDLNEDRNSVTLITDSQETLKIYVEGVSVAISPELIRATAAMSNGLHYCARVSSIDEKSATLIRSSIDKN
jgi:hypothetical protein